MATQSANEKAANATFDFGSLKSAEKDTMSGITRSKKLDSAPGVLQAVKDSYADGEARSFTVPNAQASPLTNLLRQASQRIGCGLRIVQSNPDKQNTKVTFLAGKRRERHAKPADDTASK